MTQLNEESFPLFTKQHFFTRSNRAYHVWALTHALMLWIDFNERYELHPNKSFWISAAFILLVLQFSFTFWLMRRWGKQRGERSNLRLHELLRDRSLRAEEVTVEAPTARQKIGMVFHGAHSRNVKALDGTRLILRFPDTLAQQSFSAVLVRLNSANAGFGRKLLESIWFQRYIVISRAEFQQQISDIQLSDSTHVLPTGNTA